MLAGGHPAPLISGALVQPLSPAVQAAAKLDRALVRAIHQLAPERMPSETLALPSTAIAKGNRAMGAPQIRRLSSVLKTALADIQSSADELANGVIKDVTAFQATIADGQAMRGEIQAAHAELKATLGIGTNGADDDTPSTVPLAGTQSAT